MNQVSGIKESVDQEAICINMLNSILKLFFKKLITL